MVKKIGMNLEILETLEILTGIKPLWNIKVLNGNKK